MEKIKKVENEIKEIYCDFCDPPKKIDYSYSGHRGCEICKRDGCYRHLVIIDDRLSDSPEYTFCIPCNEIMQPFLKKIKNIEEEVDIKTSDIFYEGEKAAIEQYEKDKK